jgi:hypothetical protein
MKVSILAVALLILLAVPVTSQTWVPQLGIAASARRLKPAGTGHSDYIDHWDIPGDGSILSGIFFVIPVANRVALEYTLTGQRAKIAESNGLFPDETMGDVRMIARADIALTRNLYVAAGGMLRRHSVDSSSTIQTGLVGAVGVQRDLGSNLTGRIEALWLVQRKTDSILPSNVYGVVLAVSRRLRTVASHGADRSRGFTPWQLQAGVTGGYVRTHAFGDAGFGFYINLRETTVQLPGTGTTTPAPLFVDIPVRGRFAIELGLGAVREQEGGTTLSNVHFAPRLNVAIYRGLYTAAGGNVWYLERTGASGFALAGANVAAGYRVPVARILEGRLDLSYTAFKQRRNYPFATTDVAALLGIAMALR